MFDYCHHAAPCTNVLLFPYVREYSEHKQIFRVVVSVAIRLYSHFLLGAWANQKECDAPPLSHGSISERLSVLVGLRPGLARSVKREEVSCG